MARVAVKVAVQVAAVVETVGEAIKVGEAVRLGKAEVKVEMHQVSSYHSPRTQSNHTLFANFRCSKSTSQHNEAVVCSNLHGQCGEYGPPRVLLLDRALVRCLSCSSPRVGFSFFGGEIEPSALLRSLK